MLVVILRYLFSHVVALYLQVYPKPEGGLLEPGLDGVGRCLVDERQAFLAVHFQQSPDFSVIDDQGGAKQASMQPSERR
jgi:hypothetical protein